MALIHVLDEVTANQIAAGEVVERPVNAVKEMVENAVDAGASDIEVEIADGGLTYIRVTDNGSGMSAEDAKLSIVRHATSKISTVDNIYHIASLGFRGEALASISAVSRTAITTRRQEDVEGTIVEVEGGTVSEVKPTGAPGGTTIMSTPAATSASAFRWTRRTTAPSGSRVWRALPTRWPPRWPSTAAA